MTRTLLVLWRRRGAYCALEYKAADLWIGAYWAVKEGKKNTTEAPVLHWDREWHLYVCLLPCLPVHLCLPCHARTTQAYYAEEGDP